MKPSTRNALWIGGVVLGAAAIAGVVIYASSKPAAAATLPGAGTPSAGVTPGSFVNLNAAAGASNAQISTQNGLYIQLPNGSAVQSWAVDGTMMRGTGLPLTFNPGLTIGAHVVTINWTDSSGMAQTSTINLSVTV